MTIKKHIILLLLSTIFIANSFAQKQKTKPINSGFVFIDGKYIEPPYVVKRKGNTVQINNQVVRFIPEPKKIEKFKTVKTFPDYLPDTINEYYAIMNYKNPKNGHLFKNELISYYVYKYGEKDAGKYLKKYYDKISNVDSLYKKNSRIWELKLKNRKKPMMYFWLYNHKRYVKNINNIEKNHLEKVKSLAFEVERYENKLLNNKVIFFNDSNITFYSDISNIDSVISIINNDKISIEKKKELLNKNKVYYASRKKDFLNKKVIINSNFTKRLQKLKKEKE